MKVRELLKALSEYDPELDVLCYTEDEALLSEGHLFRILDIDQISVIDAEKCRGEDGVASLKIGSNQLSSPHVTIDVISKF